MTVCDKIRHKFFNSQIKKMTVRINRIAILNLDDEIIEPLILSCFLASIDEQAAKYKRDKELYLTRRNFAKFKNLYSGINSLEEYYSTVKEIKEFDRVWQEVKFSKRATRFYDGIYTLH